MFVVLNSSVVAVIKHIFVLVALEKIKFFVETERANPNLNIVINRSNNRNSKIVLSLQRHLILTNNVLPAIIPRYFSHFYLIFHLIDLSIVKFGSFINTNLYFFQWRLLLFGLFFWELVWGCHLVVIVHFFYCCFSFQFFVFG